MLHTHPQKYVCKFKRLAVTFSFEKSEIVICKLTFGNGDFANREIWHFHFYNKLSSCLYHLPNNTKSCPPSYFGMVNNYSCWIQSCTKLKPGGYNRQTLLGVTTEINSLAGVRGVIYENIFWEGMPNGGQNFSC